MTDLQLDQMEAALDANRLLLPSECRALIAAARERDALREDKARLDWLQSEMNDVRWISGGGTEMCSPSDEVGVRIVSHHMAKPNERVEAENWNEDLRAVIDKARTTLEGSARD
jgi:hypothetical protein